ncbi:secondary thiamine-phosphate synthase enzyme [Variovorax sp. PBS-H4]|nr:secondary thiamine-phosphate synthase enzyme [Variovorax sp. PBS-H4]
MWGRGMAWSGVLASGEACRIDRRILDLMNPQSTTSLDIDTPGRALIEITRPVTEWLDAQRVQTGLLTLFIRHTSASLLIQENADPDVQADLNRFLARLVPDGDRLFRHRDEGPDDMPAHVRAAITAVQLSIPVLNGRLALGTWQGIYVWEHRLRPHRRSVVLHLLGD